MNADLYGSCALHADLMRTTAYTCSLKLKDLQLNEVVLKMAEKSCFAGFYVPKKRKRKKARNLCKVGLVDTARF